MKECVAGFRLQGALTSAAPERVLEGGLSQDESGEASR